VTHVILFKITRPKIKPTALRVWWFITFTVNISFAKWHSSTVIERAHWSLHPLFFLNTCSYTHSHICKYTGFGRAFDILRCRAVGIERVGTVMHFPVALFSAWYPNWVLMSATALPWVFESTVKVKIPIDDSWLLIRSDLTAGDLLWTSLMRMNPHALTQPQQYTHTSAQRSVQMPNSCPVNSLPYV